MEVLPQLLPNGLRQGDPFTHPVSNGVDCQAEEVWYSGFQWVPFFIIVFMIKSSFRIHATNAFFFALPRSTSRS